MDLINYEPSIGYPFEFRAMARDLVIGVSHIRSPIAREALENPGVATTLSDSSPQIIWWEGDFTPRDFSQFSLSQRISKIPGMDYICYKSTTIYALNQMRRMFPAHYRFFPASFICSK